MRSLLLVLLVASCASETDKVSIGRGVYGRLTVTSDVSGQPSSPYANKPLVVYAGSDQVAATQSDDDGFYEVDLAPGRYELCTNGAAAQTIYDQWLHNCAGPCTFVDVSDEPRAVNWGANLSGGWWDTPDIDHCPR